METDTLAQLVHANQAVYLSELHRTTFDLHSETFSIHAPVQLPFKRYNGICLLSLPLAAQYIPKISFKTFSSHPKSILSIFKLPCPWKQTLSNLFKLLIIS